MKTIRSDEFFRAYVEPLRSEVEEWGAEVGFYRRDRQTALARVNELADTTVSQAGLDGSSRLVHCRERLDDIREMQQKAKTRLREGVERLIGARHFTSPRFLQRTVEGVFDVGSLIVKPIWLVALLPAAAWARRRLYAVEDSETLVEGLRKNAEKQLVSWFERQVDKGELAADIRKGL